MSRSPGVSRAKPARGAIGWFVAPVDEAAFLDAHFERAPLHVEGEVSRFRGLPTLDAVDRMVTRRALRASTVRMARDGTAIDPATYARSDGAVDPVRVAARLGEGATLILEQVQSWSTLAARLCARLGRAVQGTAWANLYLTPPRSHGFAPHTDDSDVFVLQLAGEKHWALYAPPTEFPPLTPVGRGHLDVGEPTASPTLRAGDVLYVPRGHAHAAASRDVTSMHLTVAFRPTTWAAALHAAVDEYASRDPRARRAMTRAVMQGPSAAREELTALLRALSQDVDARRVLARVHGDVALEQSPQVRGLVAAAVEGAPLTLDSVVVRRAPLDVAASREGGRVVLRAAGRTITLPGHAAPAVRRLLTGRRVRVGELPGDLDDEGNVVLVERLVREGVLRVALSPWPR